MQAEDYVQQLLTFACRRQVTDIFFLPQQQQTVIKMREMDGLHIYQIVPAAFVEGVMNYLKFTSNMDISEHRRPQVGARPFIFEGQEVNLRLSSLGDFANRESLVVRLLYPLRREIDSELQVKLWQSLMQQHGLILFSGPTGSGKTTAMYQLVKSYSSGKVVLTIEDPVEVIESEFLQIQVNHQAQMGYADLIKTSLRHRPDVLILGEIRDEETARMAIRAALSGHLVLSTVHARNKYAVVGRMMELGVNQSELAAVVTCIVYQRLILQTTQQIKVYRDLLTTERLLTAIKIPQSNFWDWQNLLQDDVQKGLLNEKTYQQFCGG
ncbi:Flp pilus assembly complex ATPase component TadA [Lactobacillus sp. DCY120]|uniref:Flp pilus assembly complex ATPase component TadA n=1 Tax=Bombilactobacillus apium TaxID=2675299 RepID=A0A850R2E6_9LACO|nr:competence type IV pilus ATPase ComGA [Bombilactobacillus apium]NVY97093.1 Flp pilus assembly complex ATPase component TadA [Bombilactobacillus apium]